jgi:penicillin-binding protein 1A
MAGLSAFDAISAGSGLALFALFASRASRASLWRRRLTVALALAGAASLALLALFYRPASWGPLLSDAVAGDWADAAKFAAAAILGAYAGRRLRRALDARAARSIPLPARPVAPPSPPLPASQPAAAPLAAGTQPLAAPAMPLTSGPPAAPVAPADAPQFTPAATPASRAGMWNKLPPLRRAGAPAQTADGAAQPDSATPAAQTPPAAARPASPSFGVAEGPPAPSLWRRLRPIRPGSAPAATPPGVSPNGKPWTGARALLLIGAAALVLPADEARAQPRPPALVVKPKAAPAEPQRPDPDAMRRTMLRTLVQGNQIVFEKQGEGFVPRCRCGPKLAPGETPKLLIDTLVATEDKRFWDHYGVDPIGLARGMLRALVRRHAEGGSTITQQLVKNAVLTSERSLNRKRQEAQLALAVEAAMTKNEIVAAYLNQVSFGASQGRDIVGVRAASLHYFGREPRELALGEAAGLVGLLNAPTRNSPTLHPDHFESRRQLVIDLAAKSGKFTKAQIAAAKKPLRPRGPRALDWPETRWFVEIALAELKNRVPDFAPTASTRVAVTFVADRQNALEIGLTRGLARLATSIPETALQSAVVALGHDGRLLGALGGRDFGASQFNRALTMGRPAASTAKIFVYSAAFDAGKRPSPALLDAFAKSDNDTAEELAREVGVEAIARMARRHGVASPYLVRDAKNAALGVNNVGAVELTGAMLPYVNAGLALRPHATFGVWRDGEPVFWRDPAKPAPALSPKVTNEMRPLLRAVVAKGTAAGHVRPALQASGKTGTSDDNKDGWFVGYTKNHIVGVWLGRDDDLPVPGLTGGATSEVFDAVAAQLAGQTK